MTITPVHQEVQRLAAALSRLESERSGQHVRCELGDAAGTTLELTFRLHGTLVQGRVRSSAGNASFELSLTRRTISFRHPGVGRRGELSAPRLDATSFKALNRGAPTREIVKRVVTLARRLEHLSILRCVEIGIREDRDTLPLPMAS